MIPETCIAHLRYFANTVIVSMCSKVAWVPCFIHGYFSSPTTFISAKNLFRKLTTWYWCMICLSFFWPADSLISLVNFLKYKNMHAWRFTLVFFSRSIYGGTRFRIFFYPPSLFCVSTFQGPWFNLNAPAQHSWDPSWPCSLTVQAHIK